MTLIRSITALELEGSSLGVESEEKRHSGIWLGERGCIHTWCPDQVLRVILKNRCGSTKEMHEAVTDFCTKASRESDLATAS